MNYSGLENAIISQEQNEKEDNDKVRKTSTDFDWRFIKWKVKQLKEVIQKSAECNWAGEFAYETGD